MTFIPPTTKSTGTLITAAIWNQDIVDNTNAVFPLGVAGWTDWTPTLTQPGAITKTVPYASYIRVGRLIVAQGDLRPTAAGTAANAVLVGLPVAADAGAVATFLAIGGGHIFDSSTTTLYTGDWTLASATTIQMLLDQASPSAWGLAPSIALASGDVIRFHVMYEAAS